MTQTSGPHEYFRLLAAAAIDGEVTPSELSELRAHLATCAACRADERAMRTDNAWLASVEAVQSPHPSVRTTVLRAAEGRVGPSGAIGRFGLSFATIALAVGAFWWLSLNPSLGPGARPSPSAGPSDAAVGLATPLAPGLWSVPPGTPFARVEATLVGNSVGAAPEIIVTAIVIGGNEGAPQGYVSFNDPTGESWLGSITRASYGYDLDGQYYGSRIEGCVGGGVAPCDLYSMQILDGRGRADQADEISLTYVTQGVDPEPWGFWYLLVSGSLVVDGPIPGTPSSPAPVPSDGVPFGSFTGHATGHNDTIGDLDLDVSVSGLDANGRGSVEIGVDGAAPWTGTIARTDYWVSTNAEGTYRVAYIEGCVVGPGTCRPYALLLIDGRDMREGLDEVSFALASDGGSPVPEPTNRYLVVTGELIVGGFLHPG